MTKSKDLALRQDLLERATQHALEHGFSGLSLRTLGEGIGSSARMLIHHFGSKEALLALIVERFEAQFLKTTDQLLTDGSSPLHMLRTLWATFTHPAQQAALRSIFELWGYALMHPAGLEGLKDSFVTAWVTRFTRAFKTSGVAPERAQVLADLTVSTVLGLLLQHLTVPQAPRSQAAFEQFTHWLEGELNQQA
jgi:AcrR family transcriptional regulator